MKINKFFLMVAAILSASCMLLFSTDSYAAAGFGSPNLGGATGLITTPTAKTGWGGSNFGLDTGIAYTNIGDGSWIPKATVQLFDRWEIGGAYEMQDEDDSNDVHVHTKLRIFPWTGSSNSALAIGGNYQSLKVNDEDYTNFQFYLAATYDGQFFKMPAETTVVFGKTFGDDPPADKDNWDFSMGFALDLFPSVFKGYVKWLNEYANYSYTIDPARNTTLERGAFNTAIRIAALKNHRKFKLNFDLMYLDLLDSSREWGLAAAFGMGF